MAPPTAVRARVRPRTFHEEAVEGFCDAFDHPHKLVVRGGRIVCCATRWLTVAAALRRPNGSAIEVLHAECSEERVRRRGSSLDGWGPRETPGWRSSLR